MGREVKKVRGQVSYGIIAKGRRFMELKNVLCFEINETIDPKKTYKASRTQKLERGATAHVQIHCLCSRVGNNL